MSNILFSLPSGGTKFSGIYAFAKELYQNPEFNPKYIGGVSAGAIAGSLWVTKKLDLPEVDQLALSYNLDTFFYQKPVNQNGKITLGAIWRILTGKPSLGDQSKLISILKSFIDDQDIIDWQNDPLAPRFYVGVVDMASCRHHIIDLKDKSVTPELFFKWILASASIPGFTAPVEIDECYYVDGGIRNTNISVDIMHLHTDIDEVVSLWNRPINYKGLEMRNDQFEKKNTSINNFIRLAEIMSIEVSKGDEFAEIIMTQNLNIKRYAYHLPIVMSNTYDVKPDKIKRLYNEGKLLGQSHNLIIKTLSQ